jgi:hypothetical protein
LDSVPVAMAYLLGPYLVHSNFELHLFRIALIQATDSSLAVISTLKHGSWAESATD